MKHINAAIQKFFLKKTRIQFWILLVAFALYNKVLAQPPALFYQVEDIVSTAGLGFLPSSKELIGYEYFYNNDPGVGFAAFVPLAGPFADSILLNANNFPGLVLTTPGFHTFCLRFKNSWGVWGQTDCRPFYFSSDGFIVNATPDKINRLEYFFDKDTLPRISFGTFPISPSSDSISLQNVFTWTGIPAGWHTILTRVGTENGVWSHLESRPVYISSDGFITTATSSPINKIECYFDKDTIPRISLRSFSVIPSLDSIFFLNAITATGLQPGWHTMMVRAGSANGQWSHAENRPIFVNDLAKYDFGNAMVPIDSVQYFFDDLITGPSIKVAFSPSSDSVSNIFQNAFIGLSEGFHRSITRVRSKNGIWSHPEVRPLYVAPQNLNDASLGIAKITTGYYSIDNLLSSTFLGTPFAFSPSTDSVSFASVFNATPFLSVGGHFLNIQVRNELGYFSHPESVKFIVATPFVMTLPSINTNLVGCTNYSLIWSRADNAPYQANLDYTLNNGATWFPIIKNLLINSVGLANYTWQVPNISSSNVNVRISDNLNVNVSTISPRFNISRTTSLSGITISYPNGGESFGTGNQITVLASITGFVNQFRLEFSQNDGISWSNITFPGTFSGSASYIVPPGTSTKCLIRAYDLLNSCISDYSNNYFTIGATPALQITRPTSNEIIKTNQSYSIGWQSQYLDASDLIHLEYSNNNGTSWKTLAQNIPNTGSYNWMVPDTLPIGDFYKIRSTNLGAFTTTGLQLGTFKIRQNRVVGNTQNKPITITGFPYIFSDSTFLYSDNYTTSTGFGQPSPDVFFTFRAPPCLDSMSIALCTSTFDTYLHILDSLGNTLTYNNDACGNRSFIGNNNFKSGQKYFIVVEGNSTLSGIFNLQINLSTVQANLGPDKTICNGAKLLLTTKSLFGATYTWNLPSAGSIPSVYVSIPGIYVVSTFKNQCIKTDSIKINSIDKGTLTGSNSLFQKEVGYFLLTSSVFNTTTWEQKLFNIWTTLSGVSTVSLSKSFNDKGTIYLRTRNYSSQCATSIISDSLTITIKERVGNSLQNPYIAGTILRDTIWNGNTSLFTNNHILSTLTGNKSPDVYYRFKVSNCTDSIVFNSCNTTWNSKIYLYNGLGGFLKAGNSCGNGSTLSYKGFSPDSSYFIVVDGANADSGSYEIQVKTSSYKVNLGPDNSICSGQSVTLNSYKESGLFAWRLIPNTNVIGTQSQILVSGGGKYAISHSNGFCAVNDTIEVKILNLSLSGLNLISPPNKAYDLNIPLQLSWTPIANVSSYDLRLHNLTDTTLNYSITGITIPNAFLSGVLKYGNSYRWKVIARNQCASIISKTDTFRIRSLPDLKGISLKSNKDTLVAGESAKLYWSATNIGKGKIILSPSNIAIYISNDSVFSSFTDLQIASFSKSITIDSGKVLSDSLVLTIPQNIVGRYYIVVNQTLAEESNFLNNAVISKKILFEPPLLPDVAVSKISCPSDTLTLGNAAGFSYQLKNIGRKDINQIFYDAYYVSTDTVFNPSTDRFISDYIQGKLTYVSPDGISLPNPIFANRMLINDSVSIAQNLNITAPNFTVGNWYYLLIRSDYRNDLGQELNENNNNAVACKFFVQSPKYPDLTGAIQTFTGYSLSGTPIQLSYTLSNLGMFATQKGKPWYDHIYLSKKSTFNADSSILLFQPVYNDTIVNLGTPVSKSAQVYLPNVISGTYYLYLSVNHNRSVLESNYTNNISGPISITITQSTLAGLVPCDNFANACEVNTGNGNYGYETYSMDLFFDQATKETGEQFIDNSLFKSLWYKLYIPTTRWVKIEVPAALNQSHLAGNTNVFVDVFRTPRFSGFLPLRQWPQGDSSDLADFTQFDRYGNTINTCLSEGTYYIRFSSGQIADYLKNIPVKANIVLSTNGEQTRTSLYDRPKDAYVFPSLNLSANRVSFLTGCLSIDSDKELFKKGNITFTGYKQTNWFVFKTGSLTDGIKLYLNSPDVETFDEVGCNIYIGNGTLVSPDNLQLMQNHIFRKNNRYGDTAQSFYLNCVFQPNTFYTVQLFFKNRLNLNFDLSIQDFGKNTSLGHNLTQPVVLGTLPTNNSASGYLTTFRNTFKCESNYMNNPSPCVKNRTLSGQNFYYSNQEFQLSHWYSFRIQKGANLKANIQNAETQVIYARLYKGNSMACITNTSALALIDSFYFNKEPLIDVSCLDSGQYTIQILAKIIPKALDGFSSALGKSYTLNIFTQDARPLNRFNLDDSDKINKINDLIPLSSNQIYTSISDTLGCQPTKLPISNSCRNLPSNAAIYRSFKINTTGLMAIRNDLIPQLPTGDYVQHKLFKGNAALLVSITGSNQKLSFPNDITQGNCIDLSAFWKKYCLDSGAYTILTLGTASQAGLMDKPAIMFNPIRSRFDAPNRAENIGDITSQILNLQSIFSAVDTFSCEISKFRITSDVPCGNVSKMHFREFYINTSIPLTIKNTLDYGSFRLYMGRASTSLVGSDSVSLQKIPLKYSAQASNCVNYWESDLCNNLPAGWYTLVSTFENSSWQTSNNQYQTPDFFKSQIQIQKLVVSAISKYNRPSSAFIKPDTLEWDLNEAISDYQFPVFSKQIALPSDGFTCVDDSLALKNVVTFPGSFNRASFYVFTLGQGKDFLGQHYPSNLSKEYFLSLNIGAGFLASLYLGNVKTDSVTFKTKSPISPCNSYLNYCKLSAGTYTLVVYANNSHIYKTVAPSLYIDKVEKSRYDFFKKAYDFDSIPGNGIQYTKALRDFYLPNPDYPNRAFSNTFFSCTTGAFLSDPLGFVDNGCTDPSLCYCWVDWTTDANRYPVQPNKNQKDNRKNMWYTFRVQGAGQVSVQVFNRSPDYGGLLPAAANDYEKQYNELVDNLYGLQYPFSIYMADEEAEGVKSFDQLLNTSTLDSVTKNGTNNSKGLVFLGNNSRLSPFRGCAKSSPIMSWSIDPCEKQKARRYYVLVENYSGQVNYTNNKPNNLPNSQVEVGVTFAKVPSGGTKNDFYSQALSIKDSITSKTVLKEGIYIGPAATMSCATTDVADQLFCGSRTIWFKFNSNIMGKIRLRYRIIDSTKTTSKTIINENGDIVTVYDYSKIVQTRYKSIDKLNNQYGEEMVLYKSLVAGDSSRKGLRKITLADFSINGDIYGEGCLNKGDYYLVITGCYSTSNQLQPIIELIPDIGDLCSSAYALNVTDKDLLFKSVRPVDCSSWGEDFGEDFSNTACYFDGSLNSYPKSFKNKNEIKSTWFKVSVGDIGPSNLNFKVRFTERNGSRFVYDSLIKYRIFYGTCSAMRGGECSNSPRQEFTLDCRAPNKSYYVQVTTPWWALGDVDLSVRASTPANPLCVPIDYDRPLADFRVENGCQGTPLLFTNLSTQGDSIEYKWNFGHQNAVSSSKSPTYVYPNDNQSTPYDVRLVVKNIAKSLSDTLVKTIYTDFKVPGKVTVTDISPNKNLNQKNVFVIGSTLNFNSNIPSIYDTTSKQVVWDFGTTGNTNQSIQLNPTNVSFSAPDTGFKLVTLKITKGFCTNVVIDSIAISPNYHVSLGSDTSICPQTGYTLDGSSEGLIFEWNGISGNRRYLQPVFSGKYKVKVTNRYGLIRTDSAFIQILDTNKINLGSDKSICTNEITTLDAGTAKKYNWSTGDTIQKIEVSSSGTYVVRAINNLGCVETKRIQVKKLQNPISGLPSDTLICENARVSLDTSNSKNKVLWSNQDTTLFTYPSSSGPLIVEINSPLNCVIKDTINIKLFQYPTSLLPSNHYACKDEEAKISGPSGFSKYLWNTNDTVKNISTTVLGLLQLDVIDSIGCKATFKTNVAKASYPNIKIDTLNGFLYLSHTTINHTWSVNSPSSSIPISKLGIYSVSGYTQGNCRFEDQINLLPKPYNLRQECVIDSNFAIWTLFQSTNIPNIYFWKLRNSGSEGSFIPTKDSTSFSTPFVRNEILDVSFQKQTLVSDSISLLKCEEENDCSHIKIYPNPADNYINLVVGKGNNSNLKSCPTINYSIYDNQSKLIDQKERIETQKPYEINLKKMTSGIYLILIETDGMKKTLKFAINK